VARSHDREMAPVEGGDLCLAIALAERDRAGIHEPKVQILVGLLQLGGARQVGVGRMRDQVGATCLVGSSVRSSSRATTVVLRSDMMQILHQMQYLFNVLLDEAGMADTSRPAPLGCRSL
jgi:hypothetical protein